jgi:DNA polymerase elongation subunit (family B)
MLEDFSVKRKKYQLKMEEFEEDSPEYQLYDNRQNSAKILMNSNYGVQGLKSFRFSNSHLAHTITTQGKLTIKLAQYITDKYLNQKFE